MTTNYEPTPYLNYKYNGEPNTSLIPLLLQSPLRRIRTPHTPSHFDPSKPPHSSQTPHARLLRLSGATLR